MSTPGEMARARSALDAAQSELHTIQLKLAPLRAAERRALARVAEASQHLRLLKGEAVPPGAVAREAAGLGRSEASPDGCAATGIVELARRFEGGAPCDVEA